MALPSNTAGNGISGKDGDVIVDGIAVWEAKKWSFTPKSNNPSYASNKTAGYKRRVAGIKDGTGNIEGVWNPGQPVYGTGSGQISEGKEINPYLYINDNQYFDVPALADDFAIDVDMDNGDIVAWTSAFGSNGAWTNNTTEESSLSLSSSSSTSSSSSSSSS